MVTGTHIRLVFGRAAKSIELVDRKSIAHTGLNFSDFSILEALLHKGPLPINTIGEKVLLTSGSMTAAANRLEEKGLIQRVQDPSDGRCFYLYLTKDGRRTIKAAFEKHAQNLEKLASVLSADEQTDLVQLLKKIGRHAQELSAKQL
jgi:MarR family 2-MHQ and catechol resistance regulon transcriptional repressor